MDKQFRHAMLPPAMHDEQATQNFVLSLKMHVAKNVAPGNKKIYEEVVKPKFERENHRSPQNRREIRKIMQHESHYRWWSTLRRSNREIKSLGISYSAYIIYNKPCGGVTEATKLLS